MTDISKPEVGVANYRIKRDWRRFNDRELRREGYDHFLCDLLKALNAPEPVNCVFRATAANGRKAVIACTPTTIYRYFELENGPYVSDLAPFYYVEPTGDYTPYVSLTGPDTPYFLDNPDASPYWDPNDPYSPYVNDAIAEWQAIGTGYDPLGGRWEAWQVGNDIVFSNGVDLPVVYSLNEFEVTPLYELREQGVAAVGTIAEFNSVLLAGDIVQLRAEAVDSIFNPIPLAGDGYQTGAQFSWVNYGNPTGGPDPPESGATLATQYIPHDENPVAIYDQFGVEIPLTPPPANEHQRYVNIDPTTGSFVFDAGMIGKRLRFTNGFESEIVAVVSPTQAELATPYPEFAEGAPGHDYLGNIGLPFWILNAGNSDRIVFNDEGSFTADMVGLNLYWENGESRLITEFLSRNQVEVVGDTLIPPGPFAIENARAYARITDETLLDRIRYRVIWSALGAARRFAASIPCSMTAGSPYLTLQFPAKSFTAGMEVTVLGAGAQGANFTATIASVVAGSKILLLDAPAITTVADSLVQAADMNGSIVGFDDLEQDGSRVLRMLPLNGRLVVYRDTGYQLADYNPQFDTEGNIVSVFDFTPTVKTTNRLHYRHSLINVTFKGNNLHLYFGESDVYYFDMSSRLPKVFEPLSLCGRTFFNEAAKGNDWPGAELVPADAEYGVIGPGVRRYTVAGLAKGVTYHYVPGPNESQLIDSLGNTNLTAEGDFVFSGGICYLFGTPPGHATLPVTGSIRVPRYSRREYIFAADNALTKEIFICFPSDSADKALIFDYDEGTVSTTAAAYSAAATVFKPGTEDPIFVMGTMGGKVLIYGLVNESLAQWGGDAMYNRLGESYDSVLHSGLGDFGDGFNERLLNTYLLKLSSFSNDIVATVTLYGAQNPNGPEEELVSEVFDELSVENILPLHVLSFAFADQIVVGGKDNPCELSERVYQVAPLNSGSVTRRK